MQVRHQPDVHLTYCLNVVPGESFEDQWRAVRDWRSPHAPSGLGLRLGRRAAEEASVSGVAADFLRWCREHDRYVFTINGFPYGAFHRTPVKASVYRPDWTQPERLAYTGRLADLLAGWLPEGMPGSISTVPLWYDPDYPDEPSRSVALEAAVRHLIDAARHLERIASASGRDLCLALEPEPWCRLETSTDVVAFFTEAFWPRIPPAELALVRRRIGVCIDTCHCALAYEDPAAVIHACRATGIRIAKVQLSAALAAAGGGPEVRERLAPFAEPVYFHQTAARTGDAITRWPDLPAALASPVSHHDEWRVHYHVPLSWPGDAVLHSTRATLTPSFWNLLAAGVCPHLEVETYTFEVMPGDVSGGSRHAMMEAELAWVRAQLALAGFD